MFIPSVAQHIMKENQRREAKGTSKEWMMPLGGAGRCLDVVAVFGFDKTLI
jgi:hypothetical protein